MNLSFAVPMSGKLLALNQVPDENFASKVLGDGFAIQLDGEVVVSPFDGIVIAAFPTGHAFIIRRDDGMEVLIHIGLNSAGKPKAFRMQVEKYAQVKQGDVLVYVDKNKLGDSPEELISPIVFANPDIKITLNNENQHIFVRDTESIQVKL
ncbi:PTS system glucose-specific IIA component [Cricetibacter osteomyelitidis]|uniref:PTS system glucose-specific EIIA component n=1 Tax=Cricetibacter osteomyelitidis TaxID=1521931 RepID=A0A4R2T4A9_9PAST|nr:PTS glucose transporter subunit IIA [Cricetibacter osteomyelitidis]TCP97819.1 PTS system glucose-specific IIA component [Cricetibacter osteomyelitidis]